MGLVAAPAARLSGCAADGGAVDPPRHHYRRGRCAGGPVIRPVIGRAGLRSAVARWRGADSRSPCRAGRRRTAECHAAVGCRRSDHDAGHAAAVLLDVLSVGAGIVRARPQRRMAGGGRRVCRAGAGQQIHRGVAGAGDGALVAADTDAAAVAAAARHVVGRALGRCRIRAGGGLEPRAWLGELCQAGRKDCRLAAGARGAFPGRVARRADRVGHAAGVSAVRRRDSAGRTNGVARA